ncbi:MAG: hypothetical protein EOO41_04940 [Methanobacteriota archaeon]|nr:MAG: hypothetical protein EOO41_04940 [Euryarchaeota archaeon]
MLTALVAHNQFQTVETGFLNWFFTDHKRILSPYYDCLAEVAETYAHLVAPRDVHQQRPAFIVPGASLARCFVIDFSSCGTQRFKVGKGAACARAYSPCAPLPHTHSFPVACCLHVVHCAAVARRRAAAGCARCMSAGCVARLRSARAQLATVVRTRPP